MISQNYRNKTIQKSSRLPNQSFHFGTISRNATEIAVAVGVSDRTVRQFAHDRERDGVLEVFGYTSIREFERSPRRDAARELYTQLLKDGTPPTS